MTTAKKSTSTASPSTSAPTSSSSTAIQPDVQPLTSASSLPHAPSVPAGFTPLTRKEAGPLKKMNKAQRTNVGPVGAELQASTTYAADFGPHAPTQADVVNLLNGSAATLAEAARAAAWSRYATNLKEVTCDATLSLAENLGQGLAYAINNNPALAERYPLLLAFVQAKAVAMAPAVAKRKAAKGKAAKAQKAATEASSASSAPAVPPAAAAK